MGFFSPLFFLVCSSYSPSFSKSLLKIQLELLTLLSVCLSIYLFIFICKVFFHECHKDPVCISVPWLSF